MNRALRSVSESAGFSVLVATVSFLLAVATAGAADRVSAYLKKPEAWLTGDEAKAIADNVLSYQSEEGGWPKNIDTTAAPNTGNQEPIKPTFDNGATTDELRFLARMYNATRDDRYRRAFDRGYDYILKAQYSSGGWPQSYPPPTGSYGRHITFNDNAMVRLMLFLRETFTEPRYGFVEESRRTAAREAFDRGIECVLRCQVRVDGKLTAWCAQHDEKDFAPRPARSYELVSLSGSESVGIVELLMSLPRPSPGVVRSVDAAVAWFDVAKLPGVKLIERQDESAPKGRDRVVVDDPAAKPMWARFYEIGSNRPFYCDRDGVKKYKLSEIGYERRNGYAWLGYWPETLLEKEYPAWKIRLTAPTTSPGPAVKPAG